MRNTISQTGSWHFRPNKADAGRKHVTGLLYFDEGRPTLDEIENLVDTPLADLPDKMLRPPKKTLNELLANFRA